MPLTRTGVLVETFAAVSDLTYWASEHTRADFEQAAGFGAAVVAQPRHQRRHVLGLAEPQQRPDDDAAPGLLGGEILRARRFAQPRFSSERSLRTSRSHSRRTSSSVIAGQARRNAAGG